MTPVENIALLLARIGLGIVLIAHGWQKLVTYGMAQTVTNFEDMEVPLAPVAAYFVAVVELFGGVALLVGLTVRLVSVLVLIDMAGAFALVHATRGVFVEAGGFELVLAIGLCALLLFAFGGGAIGLDRWFHRGSEVAEE